MLLRPTRVIASIAILAASCHPELRTGRCDPYRTPRAQGAPVLAGQERSAHAPYLAGDCMACHVPASPRAGESGEEALARMGLIRPVNEHCVSCHQELFRSPPRGHPPEQAFCASCHEPHASRERALLREEDPSRACLDYAPPYPQKTPASPRARPATIRGL